MSTTIQAVSASPCLPEIGFLRLHQIIGNPKSNPPVAAIIPVGKSSWWAGVKSGRFPAPIKLGARVTVWTAESIRDFIANAGKPAGEQK